MISESGVRERLKDNEDLLKESYETLYYLTNDKNLIIHRNHLIQQQNIIIGKLKAKIEVLEDILKV